jgi:ethanolaminephosphotransferase
VTRHVSGELKQSDWDLMILHYLGLDHVGHIEGPYAPVNIKRKLHEMDEVARELFQGLKPNDLLCIVSDHGMANEGGHGGSSMMETVTPLVLVSSGKFTSGVHLSDWELKELFDAVPVYEQVDLVKRLIFVVIQF